MENRLQAAPQLVVLPAAPKTTSCLGGRLINKANHPPGRLEETGKEGEERRAPRAPKLWGWHRRRRSLQAGGGQTLGNWEIGDLGRSRARAAAVQEESWGNGPGSAAASLQALRGGILSRGGTPTGNKTLIPSRKAGAIGITGRTGPCASHGSGMRFLCTRPRSAEPLREKEAPRAAQRGAGAAAFEPAAPKKASTAGRFDSPESSRPRGLQRGGSAFPSCTAGWLEARREPNFGA